MKRLGDSNVCEISMGHRSIVLDLPIQLGINVLFEAKLHMLKWYYNFVSVFIPRSLRSSILTDTDSWYASFGGSSLDESVSEHKRWEFNHRLYDFCFDDERHPESFLQRRCCKRHHEDDAKEPGIFKLETKCQQIVALCSKTYVCLQSAGEVKLSAKGVNNKVVKRDNPLEKFKQVLESRQSSGSVNVGFVERRGKIFTYSAYREAFPWLYVKRRVLPGGCFTRTIDIVLNAHPRSCLTLQGDLEVLGPDFELAFTHRAGEEKVNARTIRQALCLIKHAFCIFSPTKSNVASRQAVKRNLPVVTTQHDILTTIHAKTLNDYMDRMGTCEAFEKIKAGIIEAIVESRMEQYPQMKTLLSTTRGYRIINACPYDNSWGNGANFRVTRWRRGAPEQGENMLGLAYVAIRSRLLSLV